MSGIRRSYLNKHFTRCRHKIGLVILNIFLQLIIFGAMSFPADRIQNAQTRQTRNRSGENLNCRRARILAQELRTARCFISAPTAVRFPHRWSRSFCVSPVSHSSKHLRMIFARAGYTSIFCASPSIYTEAFREFRDTLIGSDQTISLT